MKKIVGETLTQGSSRAENALLLETFLFFNFHAVENKVSLN